MLTMIHSNHAKLRGDTLVVDRKFHDGMQAYLNRIDVPIVSIHPESRGDESTMDMVEVPMAEAGYRIMTLPATMDDAASRFALERIDAQIRGSGLIYGTGLGSEAIAIRHGIPQVAILEYDLATQIKVSTGSLTNPARKAVRAARIALGYRRNLIHWERCISLHCNGYPIFDATKRHNPNRLLYLDSRMPRSAVIVDSALRSRLAVRGSRAVKLLYSGRYEPIKGALDAVRVGVACLRRGLDIELHCYGRGSQTEQMRALAAGEEARGRVFVHGPVTFPELIQIASRFDLFVCCHTQADPSCTYLESFGAGLPIVGYANTMWSRLNAESRAGLCSPMNRPERVADDVERLLSSPQWLDDMSWKAQRFALAHAFESEFKLRTDDINRLLVET